MRKCRLSKKTRDYWIKVINKTLKQDEYGNPTECELCFIVAKNHKERCEDCICTKFRKANYIKEYHLPCYDYLRFKNPTIDRTKLFSKNICIKALREMKKWLQYD
jgi:hypothetical protein